jgi:hypothetical protein
MYETQNEPRQQPQAFPPAWQQRGSVQADNLKQLLFFWLLNFQVYQLFCRSVILMGPRHFKLKNLSEQERIVHYYFF